MKKQKKETTLKKSNIIITPIDNFTPQDKS